MRQSRVLILASMLCAPVAASAGDRIEVEMNRVNAQGVGELIGTVTIEDHQNGLLLTPDLQGLEPGLHGLHLHQNPDCGTAEKNGEPVPAGAAGAHYDPAESGEHLGPFADGHKGDLPALYVGSDGKATQPVFAPRLDMDDIEQKALMLHRGGDNYSDEPQPLGGGGGRLACGVIDA